MSFYGMNTPIGNELVTKLVEQATHITENKFSREQIVPFIEREIQKIYDMGHKEIRTEEVLSAITMHINQAFKKMKHEELKTEEL